jgi:hypothetical protein
VKVVLAFHYHFGKNYVFKIIQYLGISRAEDRCRHYMINQLKNSKYNVIGEAKVHRSLDELIEYYRTVRFLLFYYLIYFCFQHELSNWNDRLTQPCKADWSQYDHESLMPIQNGSSHRAYHHVKNLPNRSHVNKIRFPNGLIIDK